MLIFSRFLLVFSFLSLPFLVLPHQALAQGAAWGGRCVSDGDVATIQGLECIFGNILQVIVAFAGLAFFVMFIVGGFKYITSMGDPKAMAASNSVLTNAIIGLVGLIGSFILITLIGKITGLPITDFKIPGP